jgi:glutathione S-transferase
VSDDATAEPNDQPLFHAAMPDDWAAAFQTGEYTMSTRGMTLDDVGFIHMSTREQVEATANRFYADVDQLVLLTVDQLKVPSKIVWEPPSHDSDVLFPHIYGPLPVSAVVLTNYWFRTIDESGAGWSLDSL